MAGGGRGRGGRSDDNGWTGPLSLMMKPAGEGNYEDDDGDKDGVHCHWAQWGCSSRRRW